MEARVKSQVMTFFKISGFHLRSEVALLLVEKIKDLPEKERKEKIDKIFSSIQNQTLETANIEKEHMMAAIRVRSYSSHLQTSTDPTNFPSRNVHKEDTRSPRRSSVSSMPSTFPAIST
jgi:ABC-type uncharacterized transport system ATPase component